MQLLSGLADEFRQPGLDVHVDVFQRVGPFECARFDLGAYGLEAANHRIALFIGQNADFRKHPRMGDRTVYVVVI